MARLRSQDGFTMVELLAVMALTLVVMFATLNAFDGFERTSKANERLTQAQDTARREIDVLARAVRNAVPSGGATDAVDPASGPLDLRISSYREGTALATARRWCVDTVAGRLHVEEPSVASGWSTPGTACPSGAPDWEQVGRVDRVLNGASAPLFTYVRSGSGVVRTVSTSLRIKSGADADSRATTLRSAVAVRALSGRLPGLGAADVQTICSSDGQSALVRLGTRVDLQGEPITVTFLSLADTPLGTTSINLAASTAANLSQQIQVVVRNASGLSETFPATITCT